ncbi:MAG: PASTA domain-containing protein [Polyangiaceae bacterium]|nr:PASTA domain-containing protein [Polyangiaceae bacterium]
MKNLELGRAQGIRTRMGVLCGTLALGLSLVLTGAYNIQVRDTDGWRALAEKQRLRRLHVTPKRGTVTDRNGTPLAVSVEVPSVSVDAIEMLRGIDEAYVPMRIQQYGERIAAALGLPVDDVVEKISRRRRFAWLKRRVTPDEVDAVRALGDPSERYPVRGLNVEGEGQRFYPQRELAANVLGFVDNDGQGREGIELSLNEELTGKREEIRGVRDRAGRLIFSEGVEDEAALAGHNVELTIDQNIQFIAERELGIAMKTHEAAGGSVIVLDPRTGEVLAMASAPGFNPNDYGASEPEGRRNRATADRFEPGSSMKVFSMATALAQKSVEPTTQIYCEEGHMPIDNVVIHDTHPAKWLSPTQILQVSSNIGMAKIALALGPRRLYEGFRRFGFGERSGVPVPYEASGVLRPRARDWVPVETASAAFGQGVSVTNLQLALALGAVANRGRLLEPVLVRKITDGTGVVLNETTTTVRRRVVSAETARLVGEMIASVTEGEGTGKEAAVPGFRVAGKTATAQKIDPATGRYNDTTYVASFVGFVPVEKPRLVVSVVIDEPMAGTTAGGAVAAPVFRRVAEQTLRYLGVRPEGTQNAKLADVAAYAQGEDPAKAAHQALDPRPASSAPAAAVPAPAVRSGGTQVRLPDLAGFPVRDAIQKALELELVPIVEGTGKLDSMDPPAGSLVPKGAKLTLVFEPPT